LRNTALDIVGKKNLQKNTADMGKYSHWCILAFSRSQLFLMHSTLYSF